ncbi:hypothetical protein DM828_01290, partial [Pseudomonas umsongensis]|nr:hypothetical protein [Pseudomonas umsongensis]
NELYFDQNGTDNILIADQRGTNNPAQGSSTGTGTGNTTGEKGKRKKEKGDCSNINLSPFSNINLSPFSRSPFSGI